MALSREDLDEIRAFMDNRYVIKSDCDTITQNINNKLNNDDKRIDLILLEQKHMEAEMAKGFKLNNWLTTAILGLIISGVIGYIFLNFGG